MDPTTGFGCGIAGIQAVPANPSGVAQPAPATDPMTLEGRVVAGRYRLTDVLGRGGFGAVYTGHDSASGEAVAVKVFSRAEGLAPRADREARTARKLDHPNIHEVVGVAHDDDHAYLISQLVVGERFDRSGLTDEQAVRAIAAVCDALAHAHERGVVHRDVKPANILVSTDGTVHLTDFGIARDEDAREPTVDERLLGTLSYMAPEQASGERATGATDVWSAGLTLYAALTGRNPYRARSLAELLENLGQRAAPLHRLRPELPRELSRALERAMHPDPTRRPSAAGLRDLLLGAIAEPAVAAAPGWSPVAAPAGRRAVLPDALRSHAEPAASALLAGWAVLWTLTVFPMYPPAWTLPIAGLLAVVAWRRPRAAAAAGAVVAAVCGGWVSPRLAHGLAGADSPLAYARLIDRDPALVATTAAMVLFSVLLAVAWRAERRLQALALWGLGFGFAVVGVPQLLSSGTGGLGAGVAALLTAIIPAAWAVAGPDVERGD
jgi:eukaryotic-like serine/threonine-protein kinase